MNYGYRGAEESKLIKNYTKSNNQIIVTFLDGSNCIIPLTEEKNLLSQMIIQAEDRNNSFALQDAMKRKIISLLKIILQIQGIALTTATAISTNSLDLKILATVLTGLGGISVVIDCSEYKISANEIKELRKYELYLSIKEELENNSSLSDKININTLDNYSLEEIKQIQDNLPKEPVKKFALKRY